MYLAASGLSCGLKHLHCIIWDLLVQHADSLVAVHRLQSWQAGSVLQHMGIAALQLVEEEREKMGGERERKKRAWQQRNQLGVFC